MKKLTLITLVALNLLLCSAPPISEEDKQDFIKIYMEAQKRMEWDRNFKMFVDQLGKRESNNNDNVINPIGAMGRFQFMEATLKCMGYGYITAKAFKANPNIFPPDLQYKLLCKLIKSNEQYLTKYMKFVGQVINGVKITRAGLIAAAHLAGAGGVQHFLASAGSPNASDCNGTSVMHYLQEFQNINLTT